MMVDKERVWLITGASRGLGEDDLVVLAVRDPIVGRWSMLIAAERGRSSLTFPCIPKSGQPSSTQKIIFGRVDILMSNAGYVLVGVEEAGPTKYRILFDTNFFGALEVIRAVIPAMRRRRWGIFWRCPPWAVSCPVPASQLLRNESGAPVDL